MQYTYDNFNSGRPTNTKLSFDNTGWHQINAFTYDDLGRVQTKTLGGVEKQFYNYNIRGQLAGINGSYVGNGVNVDSNISFGCVLDYDREKYGSEKVNKRQSGKVIGCGAKAPYFPHLMNEIISMHLLLLFFASAAKKSSKRKCRPTARAARNITSRKHPNVVGLL